jgi:glycosyltransferase involved in cell wall biosynthesis
MLGWEFPPVFSGGLGVVTKKLAIETAKLDVNILFMVPHFLRKQIPEQDVPTELDMVNIGDKKAAEIIQIHRIKSSLYSPYLSEESYLKEIRDTLFKQGEHNIPENENKEVYGRNLFEEIERFAYEAESACKNEKLDAIHSHDWITFPAALRVKKLLNIPFIAHVHATEYDRTGDNPNQEIFNREKQALKQADKVIAVSHLTKNILVTKYGICADKIEVLHNALRTESQELRPFPNKIFKKKDDFKVLFLGRLTLQKGPDYFLAVAEKIVKKYPKAKFIFAGSGDMKDRIIKKIANKNLHKNVFCAGFVDAIGKRELFANTDLMIVPSVSEPFGLIVLEAVEYAVPVILSYTAGAKEIVQNTLGVDFWDTKKMANYVAACIDYPVLCKVLAEKAYAETRQLSWKSQAIELIKIYHKTINTHG